MATREETRQRRQALRTHLIEAGRGEGGQGRATETVRVLASRFQLSVNSVLDVQKELAHSGALHVVPRVGAFARRSAERGAGSERLFLMVHGPADWFSEFNSLLSREFQDRLALLGGAALTLEWDTALSLLKRGALPRLSGVFDMSPRSEVTVGATKWSEMRPREEWSRVRYGNRVEEDSDTLSFDDEGGGYVATRHLLDLGYERIAFLGLVEQLSVDGLYEWSRERQDGWQCALEEAELETLDLSFYPSDFSQLDAATNELFDESREIEAGRLMAFDIARRGDIEAIVAANDPVAYGLLQGLQHLGVPTQQWPAIVGFDADPRFSGQFLTSLRLPWEEIGRTAANILWGRANGEVQGPPQSQRVAMKLIPRLSCRTNWFHPVTHSVLLQSAATPQV